MQKLLKNSQGYIALIAILIIASVVLAIGISINLLSISETQIGLAQAQTASSFFTADGCLEEAILRIKLLHNYAGGNLNLNGGSCTINIEPAQTSCVNKPVLSRDYRTISIEANVNNYIRNLIAEVNLTGNNFVLDCWREGENNYVLP